MLRLYRNVAAFSVGIVLAVALGACAALPMAKAKTLEQKAYAAYGTFVIVQEQVVNLTSDASALSPNAKLALINAVESAQPTVDSLVIAINEYQTARFDFEMDRLEKGSFAAVVENLDEWVTRATPIVRNLVAQTEAR